MRYLKSENLKHKRSFTRTLILLAPIVTVLMTFLAPMWFQVNAFNWWYVFLYPGFLTLLCVFIEHRDSGKKKYQTVFPLPVSLSKIWRAKIETTGLYVLIGNLIFLVLNVLGGFIISRLSGFPMTIGISSAILGTVCIFLASLWEIPFCLWLAKKTGLFVALILNAGVGSVLGVLAAQTSYWIYCPYGWAPRLMVPILNIMPNGTLAQEQVLDTPPVLICLALALSLLAFIFLSLITGKQFAIQEAK